MTITKPNLDGLKSKIVAKDTTVAVIGLGYVGLPVACSFADAGFQVIGIDVRADRVRRINAGENPISGDEPGLDELLANVVASGHLRTSTDYGAIVTADVVLIDVETPVDADHRPRYDALRAVCLSLGPVLKKGALVVVESTTAPGTIDNVVHPLLEESSGKRVNHEFFLGACPERVMPGKLLTNLRAMSRVCGGSTKETAETMAALYSHIVEADLDLADPVTAELVKTSENAYRDVQIAFANELALICEATGGDVWRVRELVNKSPGRNVLYPGAGVGGHCIPKDPWLLAHGAQDKATLRLIPAARAVNDSMPQHMADLTVEALQEAGLSPQQARVLVMGYAYLENSDDTRNSPSAAYVAIMGSLGAEVVIHDPWVEAYKCDLLQLAPRCDAAIVMVAHDSYRAIDLGDLANSLRTPVLIDGRSVFSRDKASKQGFVYRAVGQHISDERLRS